MSKKVKKNKTVEDLLVEALLPENDQPYEVPKNWTWTKIGIVNDVITGSTPSRKKQEFYGGDFPFIKPGDLDQGRNVNIASEYLSEAGKAVSRVIPKGSSLICCIGSIGKVGYSKIECTTNQQINTLVPKKAISSLYNYYQTLTPYFQNALWEQSSSTTVSIINKSRVSALAIPLPPASEQRRIADKVERLLNKIDEAKQLIDEALDLVRKRRHIILHEAFLGNLTREWRKNNKKNIANVKIDRVTTASEVNSMPQLPDSWHWVKIENLLSDSKKAMTTGPFGTLLKKSDYTESGVPVLGIENVKEGKFLNVNKLFVSEGKASELSVYSVNTNDIIISRSGTVGELCIVPPSALPAIISTNIIKLSLNNEVILPEFFVYMFIGEGIVRKQISELCKGSTRDFLNQTILKSIIFPVASLEEQYQIVQEIKKQHSICDQIESNIHQGINTLNSLVPSILNKAFRGELGTNDSTEESAIELLKEILQEQVN